MTDEISIKMKKEYSVKQGQAFWDMTVFFNGTFLDGYRFEVNGINFTAHILINEKNSKQGEKKND